MQGFEFAKTILDTGLLVALVWNISELRAVLGFQEKRLTKIEKDMEHECGY